MRCFSSLGSPLHPMDSDGDPARAGGCPIRIPADQRALASPRSFSQRATSFIASQCQGIHQMPLPQRLIAKTRRSQGQTPLATGPRVKILSEQRSDARGPTTDVSTTHVSPASQPPNRSVFTEAHAPRRHSRRPSDIAPAHSLFTCQRSNRRPRRRQTRHSRSIAPSPRPTPLRSRGASAAAALRHFASQKSVVEVNGIEPMTSCLQSRRSPN